MDALWVAACPEEAAKFFAYLSTAAGTSLGRGKGLQAVFGVRGERDLSERVLPNFAGWRGSAPVRVGNEAWIQRQTDVYGELLRAARRLRDQVGEFDPATRAFLVAAARTAARRWREKDQSIWEIRGTKHDFVHSKVMCWVALDCAASLGGKLGAENEGRAGSGQGMRSRQLCSGRAGVTGLRLSLSTSAATISTPPAS
jgi:GH15 family glucan-1,4-alpha-glucosidase